MPEYFVVARNPDPDSSLPFLIRLPLGRTGVVLKSRDAWPRVSKVYCHRAAEWPPDLEILEQVPVRSCVRRGAAIDLVLDRGRENRSQIVFTRIRGGREAIFWQTSRTAKKARPFVRMPTARAAGVARLTVIVDVHEQYPYRFTHQQVDVVRRALPAGDYAVALDDEVVAAVERKNLADLVASLVSGRLGFALGELAALPRAAVVVEERYSSVFRVEHVRPAVVVDAVAEAQVRWPSVPIMFAETRPLAEEWTYRWLGAALAQAADEAVTADLEDTLLPAPLPTLRPAPTGRAGGRRTGRGATGRPGSQPHPSGEVQAAAADVRAWARAHGLAVPLRGRISTDIYTAYGEARTRERTSDVTDGGVTDGQVPGGGATGRDATGGGPGDADVNVLWTEFHAVVNMTSRELRDWLAAALAPDDADAPFAEDEGDDQLLGRQVLAVLAKRRGDLTPRDLAAMREVVDLVRSIRGDDLDADPELPDPLRRQLMEVGHDPLRAVG